MYRRRKAYKRRAYVKRGGKNARSKYRRKTRAVSLRKGYERLGGYYGRFNLTSTNQHPEYKFHDLDINDPTVSATGTIVEDNVVEIVQGTTESNRIGRKLTVKSIDWRLFIQLPATSVPGATSETVRVLLYLDKQCNGTAAVVLDILETADFQSFRNLANTGRFRVLMDRTYDLNSSSGSYDGTNDQFGEHIVNDAFHKNCTIPIEYSGVNGLISEIRSNNIGVLMISSSGLSQCSGKMRIRYSDL